MPTVTVTSDVFATLGREVANRLGLPQLPFVTVPHPVGHHSPDELDRLADSVLDDAVAALTCRGAP